MLNEVYFKEKLVNSTSYELKFRNKPEEKKVRRRKFL